MKPMSMICYTLLGIMVPSLLLAQYPHDWTDEDWSRYEQAQVSKLLHTLASSDSHIGKYFRQQVALIEDQRERLGSFVEAWTAEADELRRRQTAQWTRTRILKFEEHFDEANRLEKRLRDEQNELESRYLARTKSEVLLPFQTARIEQMAKQIRIREQSQSDEFALAEALLHDVDLTDKERKEARELIDEVRREYLADLKELRKEVENQMLESLEPETRDRFIELFGEFYDYAAEVESARQKAAKKSNVR